MSNNHNVFDGKASYYAKYRPGYPNKILDLLKEEAGFSRYWVVADIGSGTGILSDLFLKNGNSVYCIEPNADMRTALLQHNLQSSNCFILDGTAEDTGLEENSVDLIVAGQSFHWFDPVMTKKEFARILKPGGYVALIWNNRSETEESLSKNYDHICEQFSKNYHGTGNTRISYDTFNSFFDRGYGKFQIPNNQELDLEALIGRYLSTSYSLSPKDTGYESALSGLKALFERFEKQGKVTMEYETQIFLGVLKG